MIDIKLIREKDKKTIQKLKDKKYDISKLANIIELDIEYREYLNQTEKLLSTRNKNSAEIAKLKKDNINDKKVNILVKEIDEIKSTIRLLEEKTKECFQKLNSNLLEIPNVCDDSVPVGKDENDNIEIKKWGKPTSFNFEPLAHWDLCDKRNFFKPNIASKLTGARFMTYWADGAKLYRALQQFTLDENIKYGCVEVLPQVIVNEESLKGTGQLPKFEDDLFKLYSDKEMDFYLSPTAEVQLTNIYRNEILNESDLPIYFTANTSCFRSEAGSAGKDTRGAIRLHQFTKTEIVKFSNPNTSFDELEKLTTQAEHILELLKLPYRRLLLCTGDTGFSSAKTYDIEVWLPSYNEYKEISSCSNCLDFQGRRAKIRFKDENKKNIYVHTLNGSSLAIDRLWVAVVENYQTKDNKILIPEVLQKYMNNKTEI